jgi:hypothetical protein
MQLVLPPPNLIEVSFMPKDWLEQYGCKIEYHRPCQRMVRIKLFPFHFAADRNCSCLQDEKFYLWIPDHLTITFGGLMYVFFLASDEKIGANTELFYCDLPNVDFSGRVCIQRAETFWTTVFYETSSTLVRNGRTGAVNLDFYHRWSNMSLEEVRSRLVKRDTLKHFLYTHLDP